MPQLIAALGNISITPRCWPRRRHFLDYSSRGFASYYFYFFSHAGLWPRRYFAQGFAIALTSLMGLRFPAAHGRASTHQFPRFRSPAPGHYIRAMTITVTSSRREGRARHAAAELLLLLGRCRWARSPRLRASKTGIAQQASGHDAISGRHIASVAARVDDASRTAEHAQHYAMATMCRPRRACYRRR